MAMLSSKENSKPLSENTAPSDSENLFTVQQGYLGPTPPLGQLPQKGERLWIDRPEALRSAANMLKQATVVAIDAEFALVRSRTQGDASSSAPRLALLQLAIDGHCYIVDTLRLSDLSPLAGVVGSPEILVLLHGAGADLRVMAERGLKVVHYYDLEATSRSIFGQQESSLAAMLQRAFNYRLDKSLQRTDWMRRPLPSAMIAYAARDAEVTLALYYWLNQHYPTILKLHEYTGQSDLVAPWIEPFLQGTVSVPAEVAVAEAKAQGVIKSKEQVYEDCRAALLMLMHPMRRSRLLRLIADLSLVQLAPDIQPLLQASASGERAASARALGRLGIMSAKPLIRSLLQDPVYDVRKAAQTALRSLGEKEPGPPRPAPQRAVDGTRSWVVESTHQPDAPDDDWRTRLRSIMDK
ncbi:MAG TPA: HEAT repeat domain-containing protein [Ktedonobacteraceae bacterium]|nr:HEAT repeat domain-containing protein [Ktedonobacteraceae bacterium]